MNAITHPASRGGSRRRERMAAPRFMPPRLRDARWVVGVLLLVAGIGGTLGVIRHFDDSTTIWSARHAFVPGEKVNATDFVATRVRMAHSSDYYYTGNAPSAIVVRPVAAGELVPRDALGNANAANVRTVAVEVDRGQAQVVHTGSDVEVWVADKQTTGGVTTYAKPRVIASAFVNRIIQNATGVVSTVDGQSVELVVPSDHLAAVIDSSNRGDRITLVPLSSGAGS